MAATALPRNLHTILATLALVLLLASLDQTIVSTALPTIATELGGLTHLSWVVTAYLLTSTIVGPLYGKFGDLYGRKLVLQIGICIFLVGSALSGLAQDMVQLILCRALQGLGGGGLIVTVIATVGDLIPPRERGRYQGLFGGMFGLSTLIGPLVGGFFVDQLSWRWIFYVNIPLGLIALLIIAVVFTSPPERKRRVIDYAGATLLSASLTAFILFASLGGTTFPWGSPVLQGLAATGVLATIGFLFVESRAQEPILPLNLFRNRTFAISCGVAFVVGFSLFGSVTYLPIYLQVVKGVTSTESGLQLMPMMVGLFISSIVSGRTISAWGRYKPFPIVGTALMTIGLTMLAHLSIDSWSYQAAVDAMVVGFGMGMIMQVLTMAVQNSVDYEQLGVATAGTSLFRALGGAFGVAIFGAIFANGLLGRLSSRGMEFMSSINPAAVRGLPQAVHDAYVRAVMESLEPVYVVAAMVAAVGFTLTWFIREVPLRGVSPAMGMGDPFPMPRDANSLQELELIINDLTARENRWRNYAEVAERAKVDLSPQEMWLLYRIGERDPMTKDALVAELHLDRGDLEQPLLGLRERRLIVADRDGVLNLTPGGIDVRERIFAARRERLAELLARWEPDRHPEVKAAFQRLGEVLAQELPLPKGL